MTQLSETTKSPVYGVSYVSALTGTRRCIHLNTKKEAIKEAQQLYREGCKNIDTFKYSPNIGAVSFSWRKF